MNKVDDFASAKQVLEEMKAEGISPNLFTYSELFTKDFTGHPIRSIHLWYVKENEFHPSGPIEGLIKNLYTLKNYRDTYYLILHYPHLSISKKIMSQNLEDSIKHLQSFSNDTFHGEHINYAMGILYYLHHIPSKSNLYFNLINKNGITNNKRKDIERMILENNNFP